MLAQRTNTDTFSGYWEAVGGKLEKGEAVVSGMIREMREETGVYIPAVLYDLKDCIINDPTTDKCFLFEVKLPEWWWPKFTNPEPDKRTSWKLFTKCGARKLNLMPGLKAHL
jgi:8-oxo-dGTP pyrophosphatase MutT (NUDIX family)